MTKIDFFEEFIKHHEPVIGKGYLEPIPGKGYVDIWYICDNVGCSKCGISTKCENTAGVWHFDEKELNEIQEQYPEYFI